MSYIALARKWRPRSFTQLVGQEHIIKSLTNALNQQRLHHAYLFSGTRGVGKTSVARILAKALNCEQGITAEPCLTCDACIAIEQGCFPDLLEIDGASKTRVEDTRDLLDNIHYAPAMGRFKVYLIDEVHMLSQHSFNALLKTLEEPPAHIKFILATTDPQKLPVTVLSRCLQFHLRPLAPELISQQLSLILKEEHLDYEIEALDILAKAARGSMRDGLSLLDQAITSCDQKLDASIVKLLLGYTQHDYAIQLLGALAEQQSPLLLSLSQRIATEGGHFRYVLDELLGYLHQIAVYQSIGDTNPLISPSSAVSSLATQFSAEDIQLFYQIGLKGLEEIELAPTQAIGFNMIVLRMLTFRPAPESVAPPLAIQQQRQTPSHPEETDRSTKTSVEKTPSIKNEDAVEAVSTEIIKPNMPSNTLPANAITDDWPSIIPKLKLSGLSLNAVDNAEWVKKDGREITLKVAKGHLSLFTPTSRARIEEALSTFYQEPIKIALICEEKVHTSPAQQKHKATQEKQLHAASTLQEDPVFQEFQQEFSADLVKNSIVLLTDEL